MEQIKPFNPGFTLGESAVTIEKMEDDSFIVTTDKGTQHKAPSVAIAGGLGVFTPRKPPIENLPAFEDKGVDYIVRDPEKFRDKRVVISGGGDSALDWTVFLADVASEVSLVHRRTSFRGHLDTVEKVQELAQQGKVKLITNSEVVDVHGTDQLSQVTIKQKGAEDLLMDCDHWLPLFGLTPTLGLLGIGDWRLRRMPSWSTMQRITAPTLKASTPLVMSILTRANSSSFSVDFMRQPLWCKVPSSVPSRTKSFRLNTLPLWAASAASNKHVRYYRTHHRPRRRATRCCCSNRYEYEPHGGV